MAWLAYHLSPKHRNRIKEHLHLAFATELNESEQKEIGLHAFINLLDTVFGIIRRDGMSKQEVLKNVTFEGSEMIEAYQKANKNFILVTGHYGNWELLSQSIAIEFDLRLVGVGRKIDSAVMDEVLKKTENSLMWK